MGYTERHPIIRVLILLLGLSLFALGIVMTVNANLGLSPWDIFHQGMSRRLGITMGQASLIVGLVIIGLNFFFKEKLGIGTVLNVFFISFLMDLLFRSGLIPVADTLPKGLMLMIPGLAVIGLASYFYISAGLGAGPRDGLMVILTKRTGIDVALVRNGIEITASVIGFFLGGTLGVGTLICAFTIGYFVKFFFMIFRTDIKAIRHDYLDKEGIQHFLTGRRPEDAESIG